jgi:hypothetical protein
VEQTGYPVRQPARARTNVSEGSVIRVLLIVPKWAGVDPVSRPHAGSEHLVGHVPRPEPGRFDPNTQGIVVAPR